jgi:hypothetical protein
MPQARLAVAQDQIDTDAHHAIGGTALTGAA